jgi:predicted nucleotidyltransferase
VVVMMDRATAEAARPFLHAVGRRFPVTGGILFGSRARGVAGDESDADVAVLLTGVPSSAVTAMLEMVEAAYQDELVSGIVISPLPVWQRQWEHPEEFSNPALLKAIQREGIRL